MQQANLKGSRLSRQQERLWLLQNNSSVYRSQCAVLLEGRVDVPTLFQALQELSGSHEILHTLFYTLPGMDTPVQVIDQSLRIQPPFINMETVKAPLRDALLASAFAQLEREPFDLEHGPLLRLVVFRLSAHTHMLLVSLPAMCADAATLPLLVTELGRRYEALGRKQDEFEEPLQYIDVSAWQDDLLEAESAHRPQEYWKRIDLSHLSQIVLPFSGDGEGSKQDSTQIDAARFEPQTLTVVLEEGIAERVAALSREQQVSQEAWLLTCWRVLLYRLTNEAELVIGIGGDGRIYEDLADALGLYTRFVPLSIQNSGEQSFEQAVAAVHHALQEAMQWQTYFCWPTSAQERGESGYFPVTFEYERWPTIITSTPLTFSLQQRVSYTEPFLLKLSVLRTGELLQLDIHYDPRHFQREQAYRLSVVLQTLLRQVVARPQTAIGALALLDATEQERVLAPLRAPQRLLRAQGLVQHFEEQARQIPEHLAVKSFEEELTYRQLNSRANQLARVLQRYGIGSNQPIGLCVSRSAQMIVALLAILKAGAAYVPLDPENPRTRLVTILEALQPPLVLANQGLLPRLSKWDGQVLALETLYEQAQLEDASDLGKPYEPEDLTYIIYTSGSTGAPKGVMISQQSVMNYISAMRGQLQPEQGWQFVTVSTLAADLGNTVVFCSLAVGGCLHVLDYQAILSAEEFARRVADHPIDVLKITPSHLSALLAGEHGEKLLPRRALILGGEVLPESLVWRVKELDAGCAVYNHYGPTETTIGVLVNPLDLLKVAPGGPQQPGNTGTIALGRPLTNTDMCVVDQWLQLVPIGMVGELCIGGAGLARGYLAQADLTAERFIPHPWSRQPGARLYRTGDLVRLSPSGRLEFIGRRDAQIKLRGYRIELGEIEAALKQHPEIRDSAVLLVEGPHGDAQLVGYIVPRKQPGPKNKDVRNHLLAYVPEYMVPATFVRLKALPLTVNGKVDRQQLAQLAREKDREQSLQREVDGSAASWQRPRDVIEFRLVRIWEELLQIQPIGLTDNFFELGGHSILAVRLMSHIFKEFGQELDIADIFHYPTVGELAMALRRRTNGLEKTSLVAIQPQGTKPAFFCVHPSGGAVFRYNNLIERLGTDYPFYIHTIEFSLAEANSITVEAVAERYVADLLKQQPDGPYLLGGWSMGGVIALEMAQQLQQQGRTVALLAVIDSNISSPERRAKAREEKIELSDDDIVMAMMKELRLPVTERFAGWTQEEQITYVLAKAKEMNFIPNDVVFEQVRRFYRTLVVYAHIANIYEARDYTQRIDYFMADSGLYSISATSEEEQREIRRMEQTLQRWRELARGAFELHSVPGNHLQLMDEPNVQSLAALLRQCIDRVAAELAPRNDE